ncbi:MAG: hypothetical protein RSD04_02625 [Clostridia bacterium]
MKIKKPLSVILKPAVLSVLSIALGIGLVFYYRSRTNSTAASYFVCGLVLAVGAFSLVGVIANGVTCLWQKKIAEKGENKVAEFLSYDTKITTSKSAIYYINFSYEREGEKVFAKSKNEFTWIEVLALKSVEKFAIREYKGHTILITDMQKLIAQESTKMQELQKKYDSAYHNVGELRKTDGANVSKRKNNNVVEKQEKQQVEQQEKPLAKDDKN